MDPAVPAQVRIKCGFALGDNVVLSGAIRELHEQYPGAFRTEVLSSCPDVWRANPYVQLVGPRAVRVDCADVCIDRSGASGKHYLHAYAALLNRSLGTNIHVRSVSGDIHLTEEERSWFSEVYNRAGRDIPYWIICCGGKFDIPIKWWAPERYQAVVDHFRDRIQFAQIGSWGNYHPRLKGTIDLRGQTSVRDLIHLVYCADGIVCGVTSLMHLAAAVPIERGRPRSAVIIAGAREPECWERYPEQTYLGTNDLVPCSSCWLGDHLESPVPKAKPDGHCANVTNLLPACMAAVTPERVIDEIEKVFANRRSRQMQSDDLKSAERAVRLSSRRCEFDEHNVTKLNAVERAEAFIKKIRPYPSSKFSGRGIIICGGGTTYFTNAWVTINMLRSHGCSLPIELWHLGPHEVDERMEQLLVPLDVQCINARSLFRRHPMRNPLGWELKSYALLHTRFEEILFLDADNVPVRDPAFLFECPEYKQSGGVFWPDYGKLGPRRSIWKLTGIKYTREPEFETGQFLVNKRACWRELNLTFWYNDHSEFFYQHVHGDKETFHLAWRKLNRPYAMVPHPIQPLNGTMCQHDFQGHVLFQHRNGLKWRIFDQNESVPGFRFEKECLEHLKVLRASWDGTIGGKPETYQRNGVTFRRETWDEQIFRLVVESNEYRLPSHFDAEDIILDVGAHIGSFSIAAHRRGSRRIYAFEPCEGNYGIARLNLTALKGVNLRKAAILDRPRKLLGYAGRLAANTGGSSIGIPNPNGSKPGRKVACVALDEVLRELGRVKLLKLDCEGSEWPILMNSKEFTRVDEVCGEYHEMGSHPFCAGGPFSREAVSRLLKQRYARVRTQVGPDPRFGWFWASCPR